jgi:hypothetical protein
MATLAQVMAETLAKANEHTKNVFSAKPLTARRMHELGGTGERFRGGGIVRGSLARDARLRCTDYEQEW